MAISVHTQYFPGTLILDLTSRCEGQTQQRQSRSMLLDFLRFLIVSVVKYFTTWLVPPALVIANLSAGDVSPLPDAEEASAPLEDSISQQIATWFKSYRFHGAAQKVLNEQLSGAALMVKKLKQLRPALKGSNDETAANYRIIGEARKAQLPG